jgi:succinate dehydrogenase / fumarate reductase cytochrome b subunit
MAQASNGCTCFFSKVFDNPVGKKMVMAITGMGLVAFLFIHLIGNLSIYAGPGGINAYGKTLHAVPPLIWAFRAGMILLLGLHVWFGIKITLENNAARPIPYSQRKYLTVTLASRTMIWTGVIIGVILIYHILHFTVQVICPETAAHAVQDNLGRPDVYTMVVASFQKAGIALIYIIWMAAIALHVSHGVHSGLQTLGCAGDQTLPIWKRLALFVAIFVFIIYTSIPTAVIAGILH